MIRKYPVPILCNDLEDASFYKDCFNFEIAIIEHRFIQNFLNITFEIKLDSPFLISIIEHKMANLYLKVKTNHFSELVKLDNIGVNTYNLLKTKLDRIDKIYLSAQIVSYEEVKIHEVSDIKDDFSSIEFSYDPNHLLGITNVEVLNYKTSGYPFINISLSEQQEGKGLKFKSADNQVIQIKVGKSFNEAYTKINKKRDKSYKDVLNTYLAFDAILYAIEKSISDENNTYLDKDWFKILDQSFNSENYESLKDFILQMREHHDIDLVFSVVQSILNNSLENRIITVAKRI